MNRLASPLTKLSSFTGSLACGIMVFVAVVVLSVIGGAVVWALTGNTDAGWGLVKRMMCFGAPFAVVTFLCRWVAGAEYHGLFGFKMQPGDLGVLGGLIGLFVVGSLTAAPWQTALNAGGGDSISVGQELHLSGPTFDNQHYDLAEQRGSVVVVDFWATWCGPCIKELPSVIALYQKNKDRGLRIVGVNLDNTRTELADFLVQRPLPWPQIIFDEPAKMGWNSPFVKQFGIDGIPFVIVVDREGKVAAVDVRGRALESAVTKALGGQDAKVHVPIHERLWDWFLRGILTSNPLHLAGGILGCAVIALVVELLIRRAFKS